LQLVIKGLIVVVAVVLQRPGIFTAAFSAVHPIIARLRSERRKAEDSEK